MAAIPTSIDSPTYKLYLLLKAHIFSIAFAFFIIRFLYLRYASPLRKYPGPFLASGSRAWKVLSTYRGHTERDHIALHAKYGPIVRIAPNELSFSRPAAAKDIFTVGKGFRKTDFYAVFPPPENPDIFTETREWKHAQMKRFAVTPYSLASMQKMTSSIEEVEDVLIQRLEEFTSPSNDEKTGPRKICDLGTWLHYFAFDVLGEVAFSRRFGFLASGTDIEGSIRAIDDVQWYDGIVGQVPWWDGFLRQNPLKPYLAPLLPFLSAKATPMTRIALDELGRRKRGDKGVTTNEDLLDQLLKAHATNPDKFSHGDVFSIAHGAIFAGSDSTASTMQSFFHFVLSSPRVLEKLTAEILSSTADTTSTTTSNSSKSPSQYTYAHAQSLPYFQSCLREAMRLRPAVGLNITRHAPPQGTTIDNTPIPGDTRVALNAWVLHRDPDLFGPDPDVFRPERWLENAEEAATTSTTTTTTTSAAKIREMERHMYTFGGGSHLCIGRNLALLEMNRILPRLLAEFEFELVAPRGTELKSHTTFFVVQAGLEVWLRRRRRQQQQQQRA